MIQMELSEEEKTIQMELQEIYEREVGGTRDYEKLINLPYLNGQKIIGNMAEVDPTVPEWAKTESKPSYNPEELGALNEDSEIMLEEIKEWFDN